MKANINAGRVIPGQKLAGKVGHVAVISEAFYYNANMQETANLDLAEGAEVQVKRLGQGGREITDSVNYSLGHMRKLLRAYSATGPEELKERAVLAVYNPNGMGLEGLMPISVTARVKFG
jgi:hypothetical protein